jgi:hypothetical protein
MENRSHSATSRRLQTGIRRFEGGPEAAGLLPNSDLLFAICDLLSPFVDSFLPQSVAHDMISGKSPIFTD